MNQPRIWLWRIADSIFTGLAVLSGLLVLALLLLVAPYTANVNVIVAFAAGVLAGYAFGTRRG